MSVDKKTAHTPRKKIIPVPKNLAELSILKFGTLFHVVGNDPLHEDYKRVTEENERRSKVAVTCEVILDFSCKWG